MITIIDYGSGNLLSISNMLKKLGAENLISGDVIDIEKADKLILPGVGSFDYGMEMLEKNGIIEVLNRKVLQEKVPLLGICLGMQLLTDSSEEGKRAGLGYIHGKTVKFKLGKEYKIPHMGWNNVVKESENSLTAGMNDDYRYYFVHSYYVEPENESEILFKTEYGITFASGIWRENIFGVQFHPEKSHKYGMKLLGNFIKL